ncbi:MAG: aminotransferase class I/II-fold pyridoxal phosphate-dependent enzyme, partial [Flavobacteriaceae bacterium]
DPGYPTYVSVTKLVGGVPRFYRLNAQNDWFPDLADLERQELSKVKLMWVSYPHMPTGASADQKKFEALVAFAKRNDILLVNDNPYSFVLNDAPLSILSVKGAMEVALELNSLSKTFNMAGWRVGMVLGSAEHIDAVLKVKSNMDSGMFYGIQKGAIAAMQCGQEWYDSLNRIYGTRRNLMFQLADKLNCTYDRNGVGLFVWAKLPAGSPSSEKFIDKILYEKNIFITPGTIFGSNGEGYIRLSLCVKEEKIEEAIARF